MAKTRVQDKRGPEPTTTLLQVAARWRPARWGRPQAPFPAQSPSYTRERAYRTGWLTRAEDE